MTIKLKAEKRELTGRKVKKLRKEGILPGNVYGSKVKSLSVQVDTKEFKKVFSEAGETSLVELNIRGLSTKADKTKSVLIHEIQIDPVTDLMIHVDFLQVNLKEKVKAQVPVELKGVSPTVKSGTGTLVHLIDEIEVEALPTDLPEKFEVDVSVLEDIDQSILVSDLKVDKKVTVLTGGEQLVVKIEALREEEVDEVPVKSEDEEGEVAEEETADTDDVEESKEEDKTDEGN